MREGVNLYGFFFSSCLTASSKSDSYSLSCKTLYCSNCVSANCFAMSALMRPASFNTAR